MYGSLEPVLVWLVRTSLRWSPDCELRLLAAGIENHLETEGLCVVSDVVFAIGTVFIEDVDGTPSVVGTPDIVLVGDDSIVALLLEVGCRFFHLRVEDFGEKFVENFLRFLRLFGVLIELRPRLLFLGLCFVEKIIV